MVYFAAWNKHTGFYPSASAIAKFKEELCIYNGAKGLVQFPLKEPLPPEVVSRIVRLRLQEDAEMALVGKMKTTAAK